jgi:hypothetical protein
VSGDKKDWAAIAAAAWDSPSWREAAEEHRRNPTTVTITDTARAIMNDPDMSLDAAYALANRRTGAATATLDAAEYLARQGDAAGMREWLAGHTADERADIRKHLEHKGLL